MPKSNKNFIQESRPPTNPKTGASTTETKRMSVSFSSEDKEMLDFLARSQGITQTQALRKAIATEAYFLKEREEGGKILVMNADKTMKEVVFR